MRQAETLISAAQTKVAAQESYNASTVYCVPLSDIELSGGSFSSPISGTMVGFVLVNGNESYIFVSDSSTTVKGYDGGGNFDWSNAIAYASSTAYTNSCTTPLAATTSEPFRFTVNNVTGGTSKSYTSVSSVS